MERVARVLEQLSPVADEIVCGVDSRVDPEEIVALDGVVDAIFRCEIDNAFWVERNLPWLHSKCSGDWIFRIDGDEVVGADLLDSLLTLASDRELLQYRFPRRWLAPDGSHYLTDRPWNDDWHIRLVRNTPAALSFPGLVHTYLNAAFPYRYVELPIYHLVCAISTFEERRAKAAYNEMLRPGHQTLPGWSVNNFYLPERFHTGRPEAVPPRDHALVEQALSASEDGRPPGTTGGTRRTHQHPGIVSLAESDDYWPPRAVPGSAYRATWLRVPPVESMPVNGVAEVLVEVRNDGETTWPFGDRQPWIRFAHRWYGADGETLVFDSARTLLGASVPPGESILQHVTIQAPPDPGRLVLEVDLVHELVRWFGCGVRYELDVHPGRSPATAR
jgi:hypothetical protein